MAAAYFIGHFPMGFWPSQNMGAPAILYCFMFLYFVFSGAGVWSIDAMIARSRANRI
jgi:putative oxidoreductase